MRDGCRSARRRCGSESGWGRKLAFVACIVGPLWSRFRAGMTSIYPRPNFSAPTLGNFGSFLPVFSTRARHRSISGTMFRKSSAETVVTACFVPYVSERRAETHYRGHLWFGLRRADQCPAKNYFGFFDVEGISFGVTAIVNL